MAVCCAWAAPTKAAAAKSAGATNLAAKRIMASSCGRSREAIVNSSTSPKRTAASSAVERTRHVRCDHACDVRPEALDDIDVHGAQPRQLALRELAGRKDCPFAQARSVDAAV